VDGIVERGIGVAEGDKVPVGSVVDVAGRGDGVGVIGSAVAVSSARGEAQAVSKENIKSREI
jgi:hypothetical protein